MNGCAVLSTLIALLVPFVCCFSQSEKCASINKKVRGMCPFYNQTTASDDHLQHISKDTVILHFAPLFYTGCSPLSRICLLHSVSVLFHTPFSCFAAPADTFVFLFTLTVTTILLHTTNGGPTF